MAFQEFYCDASTGNDLNSGSDAGAPVTTTNGAYTQGGGAGGKDRFTAAAGTPFSGRSIGDYASIYNDGASAPTPFIGRVTAINGGGASIDVDFVKSEGTRPGTVGSGKTATVGGPWKGPNGTSNFPFNFLTGSGQDGSGNLPRCNFRNTATYNMTAGITSLINSQGLVWFQGCTTVAGDGGKAVIDGGTSGASYNLLSITTANGLTFQDFQFSHNGASGSAGGVEVDDGAIFIRCIFNAMRGFGVFSTTDHVRFIECEAYGNNTSNTADTGGFGNDGGGTVVYLRCYAHDNTGGNTSGFIGGQGGVHSKCSLINCIAESNGKHGFDGTVGGGGWEEGLVSGCDFYNNVQDGLKLAPAGGMVIENCNFAKNGGWGINGGSTTRPFYVSNCGFGTGSDVNTSGSINGNVSVIFNSITYSSPTNPWKAPTTGDFRLLSQKALNTGHAAFTQTGNSKTGTLSYPDVGAARHRNKVPSMYITGNKM